tara:strand:- start:437 stop:787 length:351 start_codon:yes stop_codon:yes gene_type:complete
MPTGVMTWVPGTNLRACIEEAIFTWMNEYPQEVKDFAQDVKIKHETLHTANGMSRNGDMREFLEIPARLGSCIAHWTNKDWMLDMQICSMIQQVIPHLMPYKGKNESRAVVNKVIV